MYKGFVLFILGAPLHYISAAWHYSHHVISTLAAPGKGEVAGHVRLSVDFSAISPFPGAGREQGGSGGNTPFKGSPYGSCTDALCPHTSYIKPQGSFPRCGHDVAETRPPQEIAGKRVTSLAKLCGRWSSPGGGAWSQPHLGRTATLNMAPIEILGL